MPKTTISQETKLTTRNSVTVVDAIFTLTVDGRELPTIGVIGSSLEEAITAVQAAITESYQVVPARV